jgi:hypothetical protein
MLKHLVRLPLICAAYISVSEFGVRGMPFQESVVPPDKSIYETGLKFLETRQYIRAQLAFQTLINTYPDSDFAAPSYLNLGNSFYDEGGRKNMIKAELQYKNLVDFFPAHPGAADAQMKIITINMKLMNEFQDDNKYAVNADAAIDKFLTLFPDSDSIPNVKLFRDEVSRELGSRRLSKITGYVSGPESNALTEVKISLLDRKTKYVLQTTRADGQGYFTVRGVPLDKKISLRFERQGFMPSFHDGDAPYSTPVRITMHPASIERVAIRGNRRIPIEQIRSYIGTSPGQPYSQTQVNADIGALYRTNFFDYLDIEERDGHEGKIIAFVLEEKPIIVTIGFKGNKSFTESDILDAFIKNKVGVSIDSRHDHRKIKAAEDVLRRLMSQHGKPHGTVRTEIETIHPSYVRLYFIMDESGND